MASISHLWKSRAKFNFGTVPFYKAWAKRVLTFNKLLNRNRKKKNLTKRGAVIEDTAEIGNAEFYGKFKNLIIGSNTSIGQVKIALHDKVIIGNYVCINDGVQLLTASHDTKDPNWGQIKKEIIIEDYAWIATNAIILPGVHIGVGAVVGAGAVVAKNVLPHQVVIGNPAKPLSNNRSKILNYNPCEFLAANQAWLKG